MLIQSLSEGPSKILEEAAGKKCRIYHLRRSIKRQRPNDIKSEYSKDNRNQDKQNRKQNALKVPKVNTIQMTLEFPQQEIKQN